MRASSGTSSSSILAFPEPSTPNPKNPASPDDSSQSFADVLHKHDSQVNGATTTTQRAAIVSATAAVKTPSVTAPTAGKTTLPTAGATPIATGGDLDGVPAATSTATPDGNFRLGTVVCSDPVSGTSSGAAVGTAAVQSPTTAAKAATKTTGAPASGATASKSGVASIPAGSDLATMMIQSMLHASQLRIAPTSGATPGTSASAKNPADTAASAPTSMPATVPDVATMVAQAAALPASPVVTATVTASAKVALTSAAAAMTSALVAKSGGLPGREIPLAGSAKVSNTGAAKEKKSASAAAEGSFLQAGGAAAKGTYLGESVAGGQVMPASDASGNERVVAQINSGKNAVTDSGASVISSVGTAPVEKKASMSTDLINPVALTGSGATSVSRTPAEVNILLSSNSDFEDALKQVVHIAQLNDAAGSRTPTRIAIELQTPPGAIVNVYVSKQDDQYRAQLSTNDPAALSWVQDKITTLRQSDDTGVEVKWLPAQIESNPLSATTTSSNGSNLNWNRDGQNQNNQQSDDRYQSQRQNQPSYEDLAEVEAEAFTSSFAAVGGVA
jgi:hypothetical protein